MKCTCCSTDIGLNPIIVAFYKADKPTFHLSFAEGVQITKAAVCSKGCMIEYLKRAGKL